MLKQLLEFSFGCLAGQVLEFGLARSSLSLLLLLFFLSIQPLKGQFLLELILFNTCPVFSILKFRFQEDYIELLLSKNAC